MALGITELGDEAIALAEDANNVYLRSQNLFNTYWDRDAQTGLPANNDDVIPGTTITKANFLAMITFVENFPKFMEGDNTAFVSQYRQTVNKARAKS